MINDIIAKATLNIIVHELNKETDSNERPCIRIKDLQPDEIISYLKFLNEDFQYAHLKELKTIIARGNHECFPEEYIADEGKSVTYYRNNNHQGLVYIHTKVESDEQGLESMFTIRDRNYLDGSLDDDRFSIKKEIIISAWETVEAKIRIPDSFIEILCTIIKHLHPDPFQISVRAFTRYAYKACMLLAKENGAVDASMMEIVAGTSIVELGLMPDELWKSNNTETMCKRRLTNNYYYSELTNSKGVEFDPDQMAEKADTFVFQDLKGNNHIEQTKWQNLCKEYCLHRPPQLRSEIPFYIYAQLFVKDIKGLPLGERVEFEIERRDTERLLEYEGLDVKDGLSHQISEDAQKFLEADPINGNSDERKPLRDLLSKTTLKMVRRVAYPKAKYISNPLLILVKVLREFESIISDEAGNKDFCRSDYKVLLKAGPSVTEHEASVALFSFIYGNTLRNICEITKDDSTGFELNIDEELLHYPSLSDFFKSSDEECGESEDGNIRYLEWNGFSLEFCLIRKKTGEVIESLTNYIWKPDNIEWLSLLCVIMVDYKWQNAPCLYYLPNKININEWVMAYTSRNEFSVLDKIPCDIESGIISELYLLRYNFFKECVNKGLSVELINEYVLEWEKCQKCAKEELLPTGVYDPKLEAFLAMDILYFENGKKALMLATHPLRLKWISSYLSQFEQIVFDTLNQVLLLNDENDSFYLSRLESLSPHKYPPVLATSNRCVLIPTSEHGWNDIYSPVKEEDKSSSSWTEMVDDSSVEEISKQVESYVESHPYKRDGISILTILPAGGQFPVQLLSNIRKGNNRNLKVNFHVFAPRDKWSDVTSGFEKIKSDNRMSMGGMLFPPLQLKFHEWKDEVDFSEFGNIICDLAIVPNIFGNKVEVSERTVEDITIPGHFNVLFDRTTCMDADVDKGTVSIVLRPLEPDDTLSNWSTLNVRLKLCHLIASDKPSNTDYFQMSVMFQKAAQLFSCLHKCSHWVITFDQYIGREQIESLPDKPEVLSVKDRVGRNELYTIVISSNIGKSFILSRMTRKLDHIKGVFNTLVKDKSETLAEIVYDEIRHIVPALVLRAMGLSRVSEEILGLVIAKNIAENAFPYVRSGSFSVWLSLDEHSEWFDGITSTRADLCRLVFYRLNGKLNVDILVVEGKMRRQYDPHGIDQVLKTMRLFKSVMSNSKKENRPVDEVIWRNEILAAIENTDSKARSYYAEPVEGLCHNDGAVNIVNRCGKTTIPEDIRSDFKNGNYELQTIKGLYSSYNYDQNNETEIKKDGDLTIVKSYSDTVLKIIGDDRNDNRNTTESVINPESSNENEGIHPESVNLQESDYNYCPSGKMTKVDLEDKYQVIIDTLITFNIPVSFPDNEEKYIEGPASILFRVKPGDGVRPSRISEHHDSLKLKLKLPEEASIRFSIDKGNVNIDIPKEESERYFVLAEDMWNEWSKHSSKELCVPIGKDSIGNIIEINFSSANSPHLLIGGTTGSGKSEALNTILKGMARFYSSDNLRFLLIDPKGTELVDFEKSPFLIGSIGWDAVDALAVLGEAVTEMQNRYQKFKEVRKRSLPEYNESVNPSERIPWWVIVLDEYADLTSEPDEKKEIEKQLKRVAQKGRASGIHVIIATQKPSGDVISTTLRSNLPAQLALRVRSAIESKVIMDEAGAECLNGKGDAFFRSSGKIIRMQSAKV